MIYSAKLNILPEFRIFKMGTTKILMRALSILSIGVGFSLALMIGVVLPISPIAFVIWVWMFCTGLLAKGMMQGFISPFMDVPVDQKVPRLQTRYLAWIRATFLFLGIGFLLGELIFYQMIGAISIALLLTSLGVHLSLTSPGNTSWFFNE